MRHSNPVAIVVVGGIHPPGYTANLLRAVAADSVLSRVPMLVYPDRQPLTVVSAHCLRDWLDHQWEQEWVQSQAGVCPSRDVLIWSFSAGCVGAAGLAHYWQQYRGQVLALFAVDGWGVPLVGAYPIYRLSHDHFTHRTSQALGGGPINFYADPPVPHLEFWGGLPTITGWQTQREVSPSAHRRRLTAGDFLFHWSRHHLSDLSETK